MPSMQNPTLFTHDRNCFSAWHSTATEVFIKDLVTTKDLDCVVT